jgi:hypothetical protein
LFCILELKRYFQAAEEAARELILEEMETNNSSEANSSTSPRAKEDGIFQLSNIGTLPLKSPKRLIALQLANNNPMFRLFLIKLILITVIIFSLILLFLERD